MSEVASGALTDYFGIVREDVIEFIASLTAPTRVLEVGAGMGATLAALGERPGVIELVGVEAADVPVAAGVDRMIRLPIEQISDDEIGRGKYDVVIFADVLEHLVDPWSIVSRSREWMTPDGIVVVSIPNVREVRTLLKLAVLGQWTYSTSGVLDREHLRFFTRSSGRSLFPPDDWETLAVTPAMRRLRHKRWHWRRIADAATLRLLSGLWYPQFLYAARPMSGSGAR